MKYNFKIIYKINRFNQMENALNKLPNPTELVGIPNQTCDAHLFIL